MKAAEARVLNEYGLSETSYKKHAKQKQFWQPGRSQTVSEPGQLKLDRKSGTPLPVASSIVGLSDCLVARTLPSLISCS